MRAGRILTLGAVGAVFFAAAACVETSGGSAGDDNQQANGGIGGSGSGTVSGYGSVIINDTRKFDVEAQTLLSIDGTPLSAADGGHNLPLGATVEFLLGENVDENLASGTATEIRAFHNVVGPITGKSPLRVLGQAVDANAATDDATGSAVPLDDLAVGDVVQVAGHVNENDVLEATRFAIPASAPLDWRIRGRIVDIDGTAGTLTVGAQLVNMGSAELANCGGVMPVAGQKVLVVATAGDDDLADGLDGVHRIQCLRDGLAILDQLESVPANLPVTYAGVVSESDVDLLDPVLGLATGETVTLVIDGQPVLISDQTEILDATDMLGGVVEGTVTALLPGSDVDVDGVLDENGVIQAKRVLLLPSLLELVTGPVNDLLDGILDGVGGLLGRAMREPDVWIESPLRDDSSTKAPRRREDHAISLVALSTQANGRVEFHEINGGSELARNILAALQDGSNPGYDEEGVDFDLGQYALLD